MIAIEVSHIRVWQALSLLGLGRDGTALSEERARKALRDIGMTEDEIDAEYPEEAMEELKHLVNHPECLDKATEEASQWMISRN